MTPEEFDRILDEIWAEGAAHGAVATSAALLREHGRGYVPATWRVRPPSRLVDLGSGVGIPGIHLAASLPTTEVDLVDAGSRRCEIAERAVRALGLGDRVTVHHARAEALATDGRWRGTSDAVVTRLLGPPSEVAELALPLLAVGGRLVTSVNAAGERWWLAAPLAKLGAELETRYRHGDGRFVSVRKIRPSETRFPRRPPARRRRPWPDG